MKVTEDWWWAYWNNKELERSIQGKINHSTAKYILWKYENMLLGEGQVGYNVSRFDKIISPELEHIAPQTENPEKGYDNYDDEFLNQYINCLGNYLQISKSHNCSIGNIPFLDKRNSYVHLEQQREIQSMTIESQNWTKQLINERKEKIIKFLVDNV